MKKIYDVSQLLKPVRFVEQESDATEAEDVDNKDKDNDNQDKKDGSDKESKDGEGSGNEEGSSNAEGSGNEEGSQNSEGSGNEEGSGNQEGQGNNADSTKQALTKAQQEITACGDELDKIYKNNNLKKYGKDVTSLYQNGSKFIWVGVGIAVAAVFTFLCVKGLIPIKQALSKIPLVGKLFQGDKAAIKDVSNTIGVPMNQSGDGGQPQGDASAQEGGEQQTDQTQQNADGQVQGDATNQNNDSQTQDNAQGDTEQKPVPGSNSAQKTDEAPTIENSVEAQANAKVGDVIQRKDGSKYKLNQGDIDWAKKQQQAGKGKETVDQAKQEDSGNQNNGGEGIADVAQQVEQVASGNNDANGTTNNTAQSQDNAQNQTLPQNKAPQGDVNNQTTDNVQGEGQEPQGNTNAQGNGNNQVQNNGQRGTNSNDTNGQNNADNNANGTGGQPQGNATAQSNNNQSQNPNPTNQQQNNQFQNVKNNKKIMSEMNNLPTPSEFESMGRMKKSGVNFSPLGKGWELAISGNMAMVYNQFGHVVYAGRPGDAVIKEIPEWLKTINFKK